MAQSDKQITKYTLKKRELEIAHNEMEEMYKKEVKRSANKEKITKLQSEYVLLEEKRKGEIKIQEGKLKALEDCVNEKKSLIASYQLQLQQSKTEFATQRLHLENVSKELEKSKQSEKEARNGLDKLLYHNKERDAYYMQLMAMNDTIMAENKKAQADIAEARKMQVKYFQAIDEKTREIEVLLEKVNGLTDETNIAIASENEAIRQLQLAKDELKKVEMSLKIDRDKLISFSDEKEQSGNPAITDIGDSKRPMKIGEMYGALYDNEWTDEMDIIDTVKTYFPGKTPAELEEIIIHHLHRIVKTCYQGSLQRSKKQVEDVAAILGLKQSRDKINETALNTLQGIMTYRSNIARDFVKQLTAEKAFCKLMLDEWEYPFKNENVMNKLTSGDFYKKCVEICWYMVIQNPVMCLDDEIPPGTTMNKDIYKEFTKSGDKVVYVVWPALFLHKDGPMLYKGVVQVK